MHLDDQLLDLTVVHGKSSLTLDSVLT